MCNAFFRANVTRWLEGARAHGDYTEAADPRGVALWIDGQRSAESFEELRRSKLASLPLSVAPETLWLDGEAAAMVADAVHAWREDSESRCVATWSDPDGVARSPPARSDASDGDVEGDDLATPVLAAVHRLDHRPAHRPPLRS